jgi:hypothetical protein
MKMFSLSGVRYHVISCIVFICLFSPADGIALTYAPVFNSIISADSHQYSNAGVRFSFPRSTEISVFPYNVYFPLGKILSPVRVEGFFKANFSRPETVIDDKLFDMLIPLFIGSLFIGFAGIIRKFGSRSEPVKRFARMNVEAPYKKAVPS